jgi:hypothetical protein
MAEIVLLGREFTRHNCINQRKTARGHAILGLAANQYRSASILGYRSLLRQRQRFGFYNFSDVSSPGAASA